MATRRRGSGKTDASDNAPLRTHSRRDFLAGGLTLGAYAAVGSVLPGVLAADEQRTTGPKAGSDDKTSSFPGGKRPNVVFVISDDHRWDLMGCAGNPYLNTPNFDRLAQEGCLFENAFAVAGVCSPSRAAFLTGKYSHQCGAPGIFWKNTSFLRNETPFPARLHAAGYHSAHFGKWHLGEGHLPKPGYDHWAGFEWLGDFFDTRVWINGRMRQFKGYSDDVLARLAAEHIRQRAHTGQPFCVYLGLKAPHLPFSYPPRHEHALDGVDIPKPASYDEDYDKTGKAPCMKTNRIRIETFKGGLPLFDNSWEKYVKSYYRAVMAIDDALGVVMKAIDEAGIADHTILVYTSDQGYTLGEHGMTGKHYAYEQAMRIPMLVRCPGLTRPGSRRRELVLNIDVAPTLLDLCGERIPEDMAGRSWKPILQAEARPVENWREDFMFEFWSNVPDLPAQLAVRTSRCKLITYQYLEFRELYDLEKDPHETRNVIGRPEYAEVLADMERRLERLKRETGWTRRERQPITSCYILGPVHETEEARVAQSVLREPFDAGRRLKVNGKTFAWKRVTASDGGFRIAEAVGKGKGCIAFIAIPLVRLTKWDPHVILNHAPKRPMKAYVSGEQIWELRSGLRGRHCNPPLSAKETVVVLRTPTAGPGKVAMSINAPAGSVRLP